MANGHESAERQHEDAWIAFLTHNPLEAKTPEPRALDKKELGKRRKELSLGDINPILKPIDFGNKAVVDSNILVVRNIIKETRGVEPEYIDAVAVYSPIQKRLFPRLVTRFIVDELPEEKLQLLEQLVTDTYQGTVRTRTAHDGQKVKPQEAYPPLRKGDTVYSNTNGWYMGTGDKPTDSAYTGLFVYKDLGDVTTDNFSDNQQTAKNKFIVEVREGQLCQTDVVEFITQVSNILAHGKTLPRGDLIYKIYYDLIRLGMKTIDDKSVYGMEFATDVIKSRLFTPLASQDLSQGIKQEPESVLTVGVPGTGKTLIAMQLINENTGVFIVPITPGMLREELKKPAEKQELLPRIAEISSITDKKVVLHIDDIEEIAKSEQGQSNFQNLMAGIRDHGFYLLASTNEPWEIEEALIQPQRLAVLIYCGLQDEIARREILKIHATKKSSRRGLPLFDSDESREIIIDEVARHTEHFTPRYLAQIANAAKANLATRVAIEKGTTIGLTEEDLEGYTFDAADWEKALIDVASRYDKQGIIEKDKRLRKFVEKVNKANSMHISPRGDERTLVFSKEAHRRLAEIREEKQGTTPNS